MSNEVNNTIKLYPSNWLYNAGVIGFLRVLKECGENVEDWLKDDGGVEVKKDIFKGLKDHVKQFYFSDNKIASIVGKSPIYRNYLQSTWKDDFIQFVQVLNTLRRELSCGICGDGFYIPNNELQNLSDTIRNKFLPGIRNFDVRLNNYLAPSKKFPNSFWNNHTSLQICDLCGYILIHHHLALTQLSDSSEIFINAPSFKLMWYLNTYAKTLYEKEQSYKRREILGISLIEMESRFYIQLGRWEKMNIEVVSKYKDKIEFFFIPSEVIDLLSDREIASLLADIGERKILNMILDKKFKEILSFAERVLKIALKKTSERGKQEKDFIDQEIKLSKNNNNLIDFSQKLFKLYALIETRLKKEAWYGV